MSITPRLLIVANDIQKLEKVKEFLLNRDCATEIARGLKSALELVPTFKPTHLLFSIGLANQISQKMPALRDELKQKHNITLVVYAENEDVLTLRALTSSGVRFIIYPPISGPLLHVKLKQILRLQEDEGKATSNMTFVKGSTQDTKEAIALKNYLEQTEAQALKSRIFTHSPNPYVTVSEIKSAAPTVIETEAEPTFRAQCEGTDNKSFECLDTVEEVGVVALKSDKFSGYLVLARGMNDPEVSHKLLQQFSDNLIVRLQIKGVNITELHYLRARVNRVKFEKWAKECASFCFASIHKGAETAIAFIPTPQSLPTIDPIQNHPTHVAIRLNDLRPDVMVNFEIYLYLEKNKRFFHFAKRGTFLGTERIERIEKSGSQVYIEKRDEDNFRVYHTQNKLNASIAQLGQDAAA